MNVWRLPVSLEIGGTGYPIRADFRNILEILATYNDPNYEDDEKQLIAIGLLYGDDEHDGLDIIPEEHWAEAAQKCAEFIDCGNSATDKNGKKKPRLMDWEQDAPLIIPAVNSVLGKEIRSDDFLHWWTFMGAYMEIRESLFSNVVSIRQKKAKNKKLEKYEQEFYAENRDLIDLGKKSHISEANKEELRKMFGFKSKK